MRSDRAANRAYAEDLVEEGVGHRHSRQNVAPPKEPHCPSSAIGRCWFPGDRKLDTATNTMRRCCANCGKFEYVWAAERKAMRGR